MASATVTSKGQITIPRSIRKRFGLEQKDKVIFYPDGDRIVMAPAKRNILDLYGIVKHEGGPIDFKGLRKKMEEDCAQKTVKEMG